MNLEKLTARERDVLAQLVEGVPTKVAARNLGMAPATFDKHVETIRLKTGQTYRVGVIVAYYKGSLSTGRRA